MNCGRYETHISALIDGELPESQAARLMPHLAECAHCRETLERMKGLNQALTTAGQGMPRPSLTHKIVRRIGGYRNEEQDAPLWGRWGHAPALAALVLLAVTLGNMAGRTMTAMWPSEQTETRLEALLTEHNGSFSEAVEELGVEEQP
jgi:anti-sigma factor RsiW